MTKFLDIVKLQFIVKSSSSDLLNLNNLFEEANITNTFHIVQVTHKALPSLTHQVTFCELYRDLKPH